MSQTRDATYQCLWGVHITKSYKSVTKVNISLPAFVTGKNTRKM